MQQFKPGDRIEVIATKELGTILRVLPKGIIEVDVDDWGEQIYKKKELKHSNKSIKEKNSAGHTENPKAIKGKVLLYVIPETALEDMIFTGLKYYILNESNQQVELKITYFTGQTDHFILNIPLEAGQFFHLTNTPFSELNEKVKLHFETEANGQTKEITIKPSPKHFSKQKETVSFLDEKPEGISYLLFEFGKQQHTDSKFEEVSFSAFESGFDEESPYKPFVLHEEKEIDLHMEVIDGGERIPENERLDFQIRFLKKHIDDAIHKGLQELIIIHGHGKGILKDKVKETAEEYIEVKEVILSSKSKYAGGATVIKFDV